VLESERSASVAPRNLVDHRTEVTPRGRDVPTVLFAEREVQSRTGGRIESLALRQLRTRDVVAPVAHGLSRVSKERFGERTVVSVRGARCEEEQQDREGATVGHFR
jgi:hypothetical protein